MAAEHRFVLDSAALKLALGGSSGMVTGEILKIVTKIESRAKTMCPVDTGRLRSSVTSSMEVGGDTIAGVVGTDVEYASFVEFGTARTPAQPFLIPAVYAVLGESGVSDGSSSAEASGDLVKYTRRDGTTRMATRAQAAAWSAKSRG